VAFIGTVGESPAIANPSSAAMPRSGDGPESARVTLVLPTDTPVHGLVGLVRPSMRSSQPVRMLVPAAARSISSIAAKCERLGFGWPTAVTAAS
jgi:hypothetical protein